MGEAMNWARDTHFLRPLRIKELHGYRQETISDGLGEGEAGTDRSL